MLNLAAAKVFLCVEPTDMRKSYDTLALLVRDHLRGDPLSGSWFVFRGKRGDRLKILYWDGDGYAIWQKRLEVGTFEFPKVTGAATRAASTWPRSAASGTRRRRRRPGSSRFSHRGAQLFVGLARRRGDAEPADSARTDAARGCGSLPRPDPRIARD
jgi:transposase